MKTKMSWWWLAGALMMGALVVGGSILLPDAEAQTDEDPGLVPVCVNKIQSPTLVDSQLPLSVDVPWTFTVESGGSPVTPTEVPACEIADAAYLVPAEASFSISETIHPDLVPHVGLTSASCSVPDGPSGEADENGVVTMMAPAEQTVFCDFSNGTARVCVSKAFTEHGAAAALIGYEDLPAAVADFTFTLTVDGTAVEPYHPGENQTAPLDEPNCDPPPQQGDIPESAAWYVAAGAEVVLSEVPPTASSIVPVDGGCIGDVDGSAFADNGFTITMPDDGNVECQILNDSELVCITKEVFFDAGLLGIDLQDPPWQFSVVSQDRPISVDYVDSCEGDGFFVAPGATFQISETIDSPFDAHIGLTYADCTAYPGEGDPEGDEIGTFENGVVTLTVPTNADPDFYTVDCSFENDAIEVCVYKEYGPGAETVGLTPDQAQGIVQFQQGDGEPRQPGPDGCDGPAALFYVAPGGTTTISEILPQDSLLRPVVIECAQLSNEAQQNLGVADLDSASIEITTSAEALGRINCTFVNEVVVVCVTKTLSRNATDFASATDFTFTLTTDAGTETVELTTLVPIGCVDDLQPDPGFERLVATNVDTAYGAVILPGGTTFTIEENDPGPQFGVTSRCEQRSIVKPLLVVEEEAGPAGGGESGVWDCSFENDTVLVCVAKLDLAAEFGIDVDATFSATANGETVAEGLVPVPTDGEDPCFEQGVEADGVFGFYVAPYSEITLTETLPDGSPVALVLATCGGESELPITDGSVTFDHVEGNTVGCVLVNATQYVCITKTLDSGAQIAGHTASDFGFEVTVDDGATMSIGSFDGCYAQPDPNTAKQAFAFPPGSSEVTITETGPQTGTEAWGAVSISCDVGGDSPALGDLDSASISVSPPNDAQGFDCEFVNDTLILCIAKRLGDTALEAGFAAEDFTFTVVDGDATVEPFTSQCEGENSDYRASLGYALVPDPDATVSITEDATDADGQVGLFFAECYPGLNVSTTDLDARTVVSPKDHGGNSVLSCGFWNDSVAVTVTKELVLDDGAEASVGDFFFDVYDADGAALETGLQTGATFYVAAGSSFTIEERAVAGFAATGSCADAETVKQDQALAAAASVTHTPGEEVTAVTCTFVNDDVPPIPVCALLIFEEGSSGFTLDDFTLELYQDGALIGERNAGDPADEACESATEGTAELLPGALVQLGSVFPDGTAYAFAATVSDPSGLIEFAASSCSVDTPASTQALKTSAPVTFTADAGATRVTCTAEANAVPPAPTPTPTPTTAPAGGIGVVNPGIRPTYVEPVVAAAAPPPAEPVQEVIAVEAIALTGSSTSGTTAPIAFGLLAVGFAGLGLGRRRRRNSLGLD